MFHRKEAFEVTGANEAVRNQNQNCHRGLSAPRKEVNAPHGGVPVMIERHQPIESGKGEAKDEEWNEAVGGMAESKGDARIPIRVLAHGKVAVEQTGR